MEVSCVGREEEEKFRREMIVPVATSTECTGGRQKKGSALNNLYKRRLIKSVDS